MNINVGDGLLFVYVIYPVLLSYTTFPTSTSVDHVVLVLPSLHPYIFGKCFQYLLCCSFCCTVVQYRRMLLMQAPCKNEQLQKLLLLWAHSSKSTLTTCEFAEPDFTRKKLSHVTTFESTW